MQESKQEVQKVIYPVQNGGKSTKCIQSPGLFFLFFCFFFFFSTEQGQSFQSVFPGDELVVPVLEFLSFDDVDHSDTARGHQATHISCLMTY